MDDVTYTQPISIYDEGVITTHPSHLPCETFFPELTPEAAERGLDRIAQLRKSLKEQSLKALREKYSATDSRAKQSKINQEAQRVKRVWG